MRQRKPPLAIQPGFVALDSRVKMACARALTGARLGMPILISGEPGTGKEELSRYLHRSSGRRGSFVTMTCDDMNDVGFGTSCFEDAHDGTLLFKEICDLSTGKQSSLLRFLDGHSGKWTGAEARRSGTLIIATTNRSLDEAANAGVLRMDLLYSLTGVQVRLPPLRERSDFDAIVRDQLCKVEATCEITDAAIAILAQRAWPGNFRELRALLSRLALATKQGRIDEALLERIAISPPVPEDDSNPLRSMQRAHLLAVYAETDGNVSETARRLNISRNTVYRALARGR